MEEFVNIVLDWLGVVENWVLAETILGHRHDVWDVHTNRDRWWVITNPTNLYS